MAGMLPDARGLAERGCSRPDLDRGRQPLNPQIGLTERIRTPGELMRAVANGGTVGGRRLNGDTRGGGGGGGGWGPTALV